VSRLETRYSWQPEGPWSEWTRSGVGDGTEELYVVSAPVQQQGDVSFHFQWRQDRYVPDDVIAPGLPRGWGWQPCARPMEHCR
jgi:hypothetical protein